MPKDAAAVRVFPPGVPLVVVLAGIGMDRWVPIRALEGAPAARHWIGGILVGAAVLFGFSAVALMRRSGQSENPWKPTHEVLRRGPYAVSRNPMYLQMVVVCIGLGILLGSVWILAFTPIGASVLQRFAIGPEEQYLERKFGSAYLGYKQRVRRWI